MQSINMLIIVFRVLLIYIIVLFYLRIMGKRQLGELQPFELVITLLIADIVALPMTQNSMPVLFGLVPLTTLVLAHFTLSLITRKSISFRRVVNGKPVVVISPNGIQFDALKSLNMNMDDLMEGLRSCNYYKIEDVEYAIVETNGAINVIPKSESSAVVNQDMGIKLPPASLPLNLIVAGKVIGENLQTSDLSLGKIKEILKAQGINQIREVLLLTLDTNGKCYIQEFNKQGKTFNIEYDGEGRW